jgi:alkylhydroperoxidase/carboxymuconolactone decarboxylase family protein YurZ
MAIPGAYKRMKQRHPDLVAAYEALGEACKRAGPLDAKTASLVKLAVSLGAGLEGASHSHARKALEAGATPEELLHVATLTAPTIGFPTMMRSRTWVEDVLREQRPDSLPPLSEQRGEAGTGSPTA